jgi:hypothetical protein
MVSDEKYDKKKLQIKDILMDDEIYKLVDKGVSLANSLSEIDVVIKNLNGRLTDILGYSSFFPVVSEIVKNFLSNFEPDKNYLFPIKFPKKIKTAYYFMNILQNIDAIDRKKSKFSVFPDLDQFILNPRSKLTDSVSSSFILAVSGLIISKKFYEILNEFNVNGRFKSATIYSGKKKYEYYLLWYEYGAYT